jgi:hypothetical protein
LLLPNIMAWLLVPCIWRIMKYSRPPISSMGRMIPSRLKSPLQSLGARFSMSTVSSCSAVTPKASIWAVRESSAFLRERAIESFV